ncbi:PAS domain S-box protein [Planomonospora corallina]|uniref:Sensor-like histidine kinase SenX3 n=1 Tax=Planomonospora corallina TaxID=1806052 RepID=A0ABV8IED2_9ACTN
METTRERGRRHRWRIGVVAGLVAVLGSVVSLGAGAVLHRSEERIADQVMDRRAESMRQAVIAETRRYTESLQAMAAGLQAQQEVTPQSFATVTAPLTRMGLPGASGIAFVVPATDAQVARVQADWRARGASQVRLRPVGTGEHLFSVLQRPLSATALPQPGIDVSASAPAAEAMRRARAEGVVASSSPYQLLSDRHLPADQRQLSFALAAPVHAPATGAQRGEFRGWLLLGMRSQDFIGTTMHAAGQGIVNSTLLARVDGRWQQLAADTPQTAGVDLQRQADVTVAGQHWTLRTSAASQVLPGGETHLDDGIAAAGVLLTALITTLVLVLATGRQRAENRVRAATGELRRAEAESRRQAGLLGAVMDSISDGVAVVNDKGEFLLHNPAARNMLGVDDVDGTTNWPSHYGLFRPDGASPLPAEELPMAQAIAGRACDNVELVVRNAARPGGVRLNVSARPLDARAGLAGAVAVFHDITDRRIAEERLRASQEQLRLLLEGAHDYAIVMLDPDGRVASWSANAERIKGYTEAEIIGRPYAAFFPPEAVADGEPERILAEAVRHGRVEVEGERLRGDGTRFWAHGVMTALTDDTGTPHGFVKVTQDITARHAAETMFRDLLEAAPDAIVGCAQDGRIVLVNNKVEELFGYSRRELLGRPVEILMPTAARTAHTTHRDRYLTAPVARPMGSGLALSGQRKDGTLFPVEISLSTLETADGLIVSSSIRDITDRVEAQRELQRLNEELSRLNSDLEQHVAERTAQLQDQTEALQQANAELEAFSYSVSHDLRAPLRAIDGFAKVLDLDYADALDEPGRRYLGKVRSGAQHMGQLIDGLLAFSRLQRQAMTSAPVDLDTLAGEVWEELEPARADRDIDLRVEALPAAEGDRRLLRHVLGNLLGNAVKYTRGRDRAEIAIGSRPDESGQVVYFVRDNGAGFDMRYADKLFKVFQRLHRAEDYEGTGIGLALAARVVHRHGGRIWAEAAPGAGATFFFTLPAAGAPAAVTQET